MRDQSAQREMWELEDDLFTLKSYLVEAQEVPSAYERNLRLAYIRAHMQAARKERVEIAVAHPAEAPRERIVQPSLFGLVVVKKKRRRRAS